MRIFLTYASEQKAIAETVAFSLRGRGYNVFLDKDDLPPGRSYDEQIEKGILASDYLVFLVSPQSVQKGRYTMTELEFARRKWRNPDGNILPVMVSATPLDSVPEFLRAVTILEPKGNVAAEVAAHVKSNDSHKATDLLAWFCIAAILSGFLTAWIDWQPIFQIVGIDFEGQSGGNSMMSTRLSGLWFGAAICFVFFVRLRVPFVRVAVAFLLVQLAWNLAIETAAITGNNVEIKSAQLVQASMDAGEEVANGVDSPVSSTPLVASGLLFPGFFAGAVGALGTWCAGAVCHSRLRTFDAFVVTTSVGAVFGLLMALKLGSLLILFVPWQTAVAATFATKISARAT